jgi:hypothetical protein
MRKHDKGYGAAAVRWNAAEQRHSHPSHHKKAGKSRNQNLEIDELSRVDSTTSPKVDKNLPNFTKMTRD